MKEAGLDSGEQYATYRVDSSLRNQFVFKLLDDVYEPISHMSFPDTTRKKATSTVALVELDDLHGRIGVTNEFRCRTWLEKEALVIYLSNSDGFTGSGLKITVKGKQFRALPFEFTDVIIEGQREPSITVEKQKLTLNNSNPSVGDSIYGVIYSRTVDSEGVKRYAQGFFRTRIENTN